MTSFVLSHELLQFDLTLVTVCRDDVMPLN